MTPILGNLRDTPHRGAALASYARPGARVVAAGARLLSWWAAPVNLWKLWRMRHYLSTYRGLRDPTAHLALHCEGWRIVATRALGTSYLASGTLLPQGS